MDETLTFEDDMESIFFSPDGRWLASSSFRNEVKVWDPDTGKLCESLQSYPRWGSSEEKNVKISIRNNEWVCVDGERLLWLPPDYRPGCWESRDEDDDNVALAIGPFSWRGLFNIIEVPCDLVATEDDIERDIVFDVPATQADC